MRLTQVLVPRSWSKEAPGHDFVPTYTFPLYAPRGPGPLVVCFWLYKFRGTGQVKLNVLMTLVISFLWQFQAMLL